MKLNELMGMVVVVCLLSAMSIILFVKACDTAKVVAHDDEIPRVSMTDYERWAQAMLGHHDVRALCTGWDTNNDGYQACDVLDTRTGRTYPLACPFGLTMAQECKLRPTGTAP